jgi:O-antigen/teichoic acid export membrane protein
LAAFSPHFLQLFGKSFVEGGSALRVLILGQIFNTAMGSVGLVLIMTGHDRAFAGAITISTLLKGSLLIYCVPLWGVLGAAIAATSSMVCVNIIGAAFVVRLLQINPTVFSRVAMRNR